jgi:glycosyltransferase involved in cell wall biosynthesis
MELTVVMSVYNGESHLQEAIESILNQTFKNFKFFIVNNGSTDGTADILQKYKLSDERIEIITNPVTLTYVEGRMLAIQKVNTEWMALMDADDISEPTRIEKQVEFIEKSRGNVCAVGTWAKYINATGEQLGNMVMEPTSIDQFQKMYSENEAIVLIDPSSIIHRPTFNLIGGYREYCVPAADLDLWYRLAEQGKALIVIPEFLFRYRVHGGADSVKKTMLQRKKTHFINYNMRLRRSGCAEVSWDEYLSDVWSDLFYRVPKLRKDWSMTWYKRAGLFYGEKKYIQFIFNLVRAAALNPQFVVKRLLSQKQQLWK